MTAPMVTKRNDEARSYDAYVDDQLVGMLAYETAPGRLVLTHTAVLPEYQGHGYGTALVRWVLEDAKASGLTITPICPIVVAFIHKHTEYESLLDPEHRGVYDDERLS
jgi:uncharacterized protein